LAGYIAGPGTIHTAGSVSSGGSHGAFGFVKNLVHDIGDAAKGTPEGLVQLAEHPIRSIKGMGKATWQTWSPLFHGNPGEFGHQFYAHPLAPLLDIATVFTGGASLAAKLGVKAGELGVVSEDSALARLGNMPKELKLRDPEAAAAKKGARVGIERTKYLPKNPIYNKAYRSAMSFADNHPAIPNWFGSARVYKRLENADWSNSGLALNAQFAAAMKAGKVLVKGGKDLAQLERDIHVHAYRDLWNNSPEVSVEDLMNKYHGQVPKGYTPIRPHVGVDDPSFRLFKKPAANVNDLAGHLQLLGKKLTRPAEEWKNAIYKGEDGQSYIRLAHKRAMAANFTDGAKSAHFLARMFRFPTAIWKYSMVGLSPRTVVDNGVGNWVMYAMRQGGAHGLHGFVDAVRYTHGESKALQMLKETGRLPDSQHFLNRYFKHELGNTFGTATLGSGAEAAGNVMSKMYRFSMYPLVHRFADQPVRAASISAFLRGDSAVKALMKKGMSFEDAANAALKADRGLRERAVSHARTVAGNYTSLGKTEQILRDYVPFYLWDKHIVMHASNMLRDRPGVVAAGAAVGQMGANAQRGQLGDIPEFMLGQIPIGLHVPGQGSRTALFDTTGLNPYSTIPDLASLAQALTTGNTEDKPGDTILSTVNPVIKGLIEHTMGTSATGAPETSHGGVIPSTLTDVVNSMRPIQLIRSALGDTTPSTTKSGTPRLYKSDINTILSTAAGAPIRLADIQHAIELEQQIRNGGKKPKKGPKYISGIGG
jgi:hypothetical protein